MYTLDLEEEAMDLNEEEAKEIDDIIRGMTCVCVLHAFVLHVHILSLPAVCRPAIGLLFK